MSPELILALQETTIEAVKILGPALFTYLAASAQFRSKLEQLGRTQSFRSREHLFAYYKARQKKLAESYEGLGKGIGQALGFAAAAAVVPEAKMQEMVESFKVLVRIHTVVAPFEIDIALRDMKAADLSRFEEYKKLSGYRESAANLQVGTTAEHLRDLVTKLMEIYGVLERCNQMVLEKRIESLFREHAGV